jgi:hypothetical protein
MNSPEFVMTVREMRAAQKRYFTEGRKQSDLIEAKRLEKVVDQALAEGVTVYATATLEVTDSEHPEQQMGFLDEPDAGDLLDRLTE